MYESKAIDTFANVYVVTSFSPTLCMSQSRHEIKGAGCSHEDNTLKAKEARECIDVCVNAQNCVTVKM